MQDDITGATRLGYMEIFFYYIQYFSVSLSLFKIKSLFKNIKGSIKKIK